MTTAATKKCKLRVPVRFNNSSRTTYCCRKRHGYMINHWKCVGLDSKQCPLFDEKRLAGILLTKARVLE